MNVETKVKEVKSLPEVVASVPSGIPEPIKVKIRSGLFTVIEIYEKLKRSPGAHIKVTWARPAKTFKGITHSIVKRTSVFVRAGINFSNLKVVKEGIESGERSEVQSLPWGQWREGYFPYIIDYKNTEYIRLYDASFNNLRPSVEWTIDGIPTTFDKVKEFLLASEYPTDERPDCFTIKAENVVKID